MPDPAPPLAPRQAMLAQLAGALAALGEKLRGQQRAAADVAALGSRAEELAGQARRLAFGAQPDRLPRLRVLAGALAEFAAEMAETAARVEKDSLLGSAVAEALGHHGAELRALAENQGMAEDLSVIRARLRPLVTTLDAIPGRLKAGRERSAELGGLADRARDMAGRAATLTAAGGPGLQDRILGLSRDLGQLAEQAVAVSARLSSDAGMAVRAADAMAGQAQDMALDQSGDSLEAALRRALQAGHRIDRSAGAAATDQAWMGAMRRPTTGP
ncbi:hypothetical protein [Paracraurococcus ruber]|uniref:Uncharacterized protein n=1 Tax=Paracraurococcus ruber TaxID=77675 RepID=A0ABS1CRK9_9PROT|nr:hypothetical protein [Paracraurococcus ruber]MBK1657086.1 hypothetical protein [Paracraurococcus ruber]TDG33385.1 hypothetical protein E2C05_03950 [Paracraurococcus ruber]